MKTAPLLSIGMIFKNEARCIERCLQSLQPLRDAVPCELIMADTGATDASRAIAEQYADEVFDFPWIDDFAAARNAVMERCRGKWYFSIDCDEWLDADLSELLVFLKGEKSLNYAFVVQRNYLSAEMERGEQFDDFSVMRLLRLSTGQRYVNSIHESWAQKGDAFCLTHTILHHDGYLYSDENEARKKMRRNMKLLRRELEKEPENLRTLNECIDSSRLEPEHVQYVRAAVALVQKQADKWETYGGCILRSAAEAARTRELPELWDWVAYAEEQFPDSPFTQIDVQHTAFEAACDAEDWARAVHCGETYRAALCALRADRLSKEAKRDLTRSPLRFASAAKERAVQVGLANAYLQNSQPKQALKTLAALDAAKLSARQIRNVAVILGELHARTTLDVAPVLTELYACLAGPEQEEQTRQDRLAAFDQIAAAAFDKEYCEEERQSGGWHRPAYTAFAVLADQCEAGRGAKMMMTDDPAEMREWLLKVEDWQALPIEALEHALAAGVVFPLPEKPLNIEVLDGLAAKLTHHDNPARQMALALPGNADAQTDLQSLFWARALVLAAVQSFDWAPDKREEPAGSSARLQTGGDSGEDPARAPETGLALLQKFAQLESALLPVLYTPQMLCEENAALLPPMHRWGLYCARALAALDAGKPQEYLAALRKGLSACPGQKDMARFLLDRFREQERHEAGPELLALAEKVRAILAAYGPDHPAAKAIRASDAYKQVAHLIEDKSGSGHGAGTKRREMGNQEFLKALGSYAKMSKMLKTYDYQEILNQASALAKVKPEKLEQYPMGGYSKGMTNGAYRFVLKDLLEHIDNYDWLYGRFEDDISREVFSHLIQYRLFPSSSFLAAAYDAEHPQYYDKTIIQCNENEVFVDCGAYNGDSTEKFIKCYGAYKHIYAYEPSAENIQACRSNLKKYRDVTVRQCGVGEKSAVLCMDSSGASSTFMREQQATRGNGIQIISLDEDIPEKITYCKMDIEGFEIPALLGAKRHICDDFPKLAICVYHIVTDIWEIPRLIDSIHPDYRLFIRHYNPKQNWETVIYAIPPEKK